MERQPVKGAQLQLWHIALHKSKGHVVSQPDFHPYQALNNLNPFSCQSNCHTSSGSFRQVFSWFFVNSTYTELSVCPAQLQHSCPVFSLLRTPLWLLGEWHHAFSPNSACTLSEHWTPWARQRGEPKSTGITGKRPEPKTRPKRSLSQGTTCISSRFRWWTPQLQSQEGGFVFWDSSTSLYFKKLLFHLLVLHHWLLGSSCFLLLLPWTSQAHPHLPWNLQPQTRCSTAADDLLSNFTRIWRHVFSS